MESLRHGSNGGGMTSKSDPGQLKLVAVDSDGQHSHVSFAEFKHDMDRRLDEFEQRLLVVEGESPHNSKVLGSTGRTQENG